MVEHADKVTDLLVEYIDLMNKGFPEDKMTGLLSKVNDLPEQQKADMDGMIDALVGLKKYLIQNRVHRHGR